MERPDVLVLDEPTSALDTVSEVAIRRTLAQLRGEVTVIIVAHRLSTLEICDRLLEVSSYAVTESSNRTRRSAHWHSTTRPSRRTCPTLHPTDPQAPAFVELRGRPGGERVHR